jgi:hypothetical protein
MARPMFSLKEFLVLLYDFSGRRLIDKLFKMSLTVSSLSHTVSSSAAPTFAPIIWDQQVTSAYCSYPVSVSGDVHCWIGRILTTSRGAMVYSHEYFSTSHCSSPLLSMATFGLLLVLLLLP